MKLVTISTVIALGALAACGGVPDETRVTSYGDAVLPTVSQPATSTGEPAQEGASAAIAEARAAAARAAADEEKPGPDALAFSPAQQSDKATRADVPAPEDQNAQVAALPKPAEPAAAETEAPVEPAAEEVAALPKQDEEPTAAETEAPTEPTSEEIAALPKQDEEPTTEDTETPVESAARTPDQPVAQPAAQAPGQSYGVQLAAYRQASGAEAVWNGLLRAHPDLLAELSKTIRRADLGATRGVVHQLRVGPFAGEAEARALCETLKKRGTDCFVVAPRNRP